MPHDTHTLRAGARLTLAALLLGWGSGAVAWAADHPAGRAALEKSAVTLDIDNNTVIDVNNIEMFVTNHGSFAFNIPTGNSGLTFPKGTGKTAVFASSSNCPARRQ